MPESGNHACHWTLRTANLIPWPWPPSRLIWRRESAIPATAGLLVSYNEHGDAVLIITVYIAAIMCVYPGAVILSTGVPSAYGKHTEVWRPRSSYLECHVSAGMSCPVILLMKMFAFHGYDTEANGFSHSLMVCRLLVYASSCVQPFCSNPLDRFWHDTSLSLLTLMQCGPTVRDRPVLTMEHWWELMSDFQYLHCQFQDRDDITY